MTAHEQQRAKLTPKSTPMPKHEPQAQGAMVPGCGASVQAAGTLLKPECAELAASHPPGAGSMQLEACAGQGAVREEVRPRRNVMHCNKACSWMCRPRWSVPGEDACVFVQMHRGRLPVAVAVAEWHACMHARAEARKQKLAREAH